MLENIRAFKAGHPDGVFNDWLMQVIAVVSLYVVPHMI